MTVGPFHVARASNKLRRCQINPAELNRHIPHWLPSPLPPTVTTTNMHSDNKHCQDNIQGGQHSTTLQWPHTISVRDVVTASSCLHALLKILIKLQLATLEGWFGNMLQQHAVALATRERLFLCYLIYLLHCDKHS